MRDQVYFVKGGDRVKIGYSSVLSSRLSELRRVMAPTPLELLGAIDGDRTIEAALHVRLKHLRLSGEWFRDDLELRALMLELIASGTPGVLAPLIRSPAIAATSSEEWPPELELRWHSAMDRVTAIVGAMSHESDLGIRRVLLVGAEEVSACLELHAGVAATIIGVEQVEALLSELEPLAAHAADSVPARMDAITALITASSGKGMF
jgi:hypothetical protein